MFSNLQTKKSKTIAILVAILMNGYAPVWAGDAPKPGVPKPGTVTKADIEIHGTTDCSDGHQSAACGFGDNGGWTNPPNGGGGGAGGGAGAGAGAGGNNGTGEVGNTPKSQKKGDVRCAATSADLRNTVSTSSPDVRYLAAIAVFRTLTLTGRREAGQLGFLQITYADGGTEKWFVTEPTFSDGGLQEAGSMVLGDGIPKATDCTG